MLAGCPTASPKLTGIRPVDTVPVGGLGGCTPTGTCELGIILPCCSWAAGCSFSPLVYTCHLRMHSEVKKAGRQEADAA